jgi:hypothetical protein
MKYWDSMLVGRETNHLKIIKIILYYWEVQARHVINMLLCYITANHDYVSRG